MGFLKFLSKKDKKTEELADLDMPPKPPSLEEIGDLGLPPPEEEFPIEEMPPEPPKFPFLKKKEAPEEPMEEFLPLPPKTKPYEGYIEEPKKEAVGISKPETHEYAEIKHKPTKPMFVKTDDFKNVLKEINAIQNNVKKMNEITAKMNNIKENENSIFNKWHSSLNDIQKKMIFCDKMLFKKGDKK